MPRYRYTVVQAGTVEASDKDDAEGAALAMADGGFSETVAVEVEEVKAREEGNKG